MKIIISTEGYPFSNGEKPFIEQEFIELSKQFDVTIISHLYENNIEYQKPICSYDAHNIDISIPWAGRIIYIIKYVFDRDCHKEVKDILKSREKIALRLYESLVFYALAMDNYKKMIKLGVLPSDKEEKFVYYTYWNYYYTYSMTKFKKQYPNAYIVTRAHGFDLFDEQYTGYRQPFKMVIDKVLDKIFFCAEQGKDYYLKRYNIKDSDKYAVMRIGTKPQELKIYDDDILNGRFKIVSCASIIPLKRVDLIVRALALTDENIEWVHFGDGKDIDEITELSTKLLDNKANIIYNIKGFVPNEDVLEYYKNNKVNCFILTSSTEGLPVSIQEAMSFGIPIIATDVGGISELIDKNGVLLSSNPTPEEIKEAIQSIIHTDKKDYINMCENSYKLWKRNYNSVDNSKEFAEYLKLCVE